MMFFKMIRTDLCKDFYHQLVISVYFYLFVAIFLTVILFIVTKFLGSQTKDLDQEKIASYECGFDPIEDSRTKIDIRFYKIGIIFLLFDIELIFILPWSLSIKGVFLTYPNLGSHFFIIGFLFLILIIISLVYEINNFIFKEMI